MAKSGTVLAIDQGTTSSRAIVFGADLARPRARAARVRPALSGRRLGRARSRGHLAHDGGDRAPGAGAASSAPATSPPSASPTSARPACIWDRRTGRPIHNAIVWQDRRTAEVCRRLKAAGHEPAVTAKTGLLLDPYFSATKIAWLLDHVDGARARAEARRTSPSAPSTAFLLWRLTGGKVHATDATNASRTLLYDIARGRLGRRSARALRRAARACCRRCATATPQYGVTEPSILGARDADPRRCRRPAGRHHRPGLLRARHDQGDLRHRLLCAAQYRRRAGRLAATAC